MLLLFFDDLNMKFIKPDIVPIIFSLLLVFFSNTILAQLPEKSFNNDRRHFNDSSRLSVSNATVINAGIYGGSMIGLYATWYRQYPQSNFHFFNDWAEWKQMDKLGHLYSAYTMSRFSYALWEQTNLNRKQKIWISGLSGAAYQTIIETLDGFSTQWGWSWGDFGGNMLGSSLFVAQELAWDDQRILMKTSFHKKKYADQVLNNRNNQIFGSTLAERFLKDYNGQTYWLSLNLKSFIKNAKIPAWLNIAVGTGAEGLFGARKNQAFDASGNVIFDRTAIKRMRQFYLSPDINLTKIKTKKRWQKSALFILNSLKFPMPTIEFSNKNLTMKWIYF
jgi:hypothetical protein